MTTSPTLPDDLRTPAQLARRTSQSPSTISRHALHGYHGIRLAYYRVGRRMFVSERDYAAFIEKCKALDADRFGTPATATPSRAEQIAAAEARVMSACA